MAEHRGPVAAVQSVDRALSVLEILARRGEVGVTDLAAELGVHKSTAFRLVSVLETHELVEQNAERGKYRLGLGVVRLAASTTARLDVAQQARPALESLARRLDETVNVAILSGHDVLYLDQVAGSSALQLHHWVGRRTPVHCTSNGKVLLAWLPEDRQRALLRPPLERFTARTVTDPDLLVRQLDRVRADGFAVSYEELEIGLVAVAAPVRDAADAVVASVCASGPVFRMPAERVPEIAAAVQAAAADVSRRLGAAG
jgi:DNA-binding IclR family transcriptional regulator